MKDQTVDPIANWEETWPPFKPDLATQVPEVRVSAVFRELAERLEDNYPFFHPSYAGQMLKPGHDIARAAYAMAQRINPNNHALDGGPATARMEREVVGQLAGMFGFEPTTVLGHLTSSGTIANLEALWIARETHPGKAIAYSAEAHYTHERMCQVLGVRGVKIAVDQSGRMDVDALRNALRNHGVGTVVATTGTTGLGMVDPLDEFLKLREEYSFRLHVDAAYGGFFTLLAGENELTDAGSLDGSLERRDANAFRAIAQCDSVVVDPHKHGLQPYGCGSILFRDPAVGSFYSHDSPYTYFTSDDLHLGEISLECSRAGAAAAALWATLQCFPLRGDAGLGSVLRQSRRAAQRWARLIAESDRLRLIVEPALDILALYALPPDGDRQTSSISTLTDSIFDYGMNNRSYYLAKLIVAPDRMIAHDHLEWDTPTLTVLRSVLMKPEHFDFVPELHDRVLRSLN